MEGLKQLVSDREHRQEIQLSPMASVHILLFVRSLCVSSTTIHVFIVLFLDLVAASETAWVNSGIFSSINI